MIEFILYTYGYGDLMIFVLNGIAKFRNSGAYTSILFVTAGAVISYYATRMAAATTPGGWRIWVHKTVSTLLLIQVLMLPTVTLVVKDEVSWKVPRTVDNIPAAFGVPVSLIEGWGHAMVKGFEQAFNWTGKKRLNSYSKHGTVFGARMAQDIARAKIRNPEVSQSVNSFVDRCIITRGLIGYPFTLQEVRNSNNVWKLVRDRTRGVVTKWKKYEKGGVTIHNCTEGVRWMEGLMATEIKDIVGMFMKKHHQDKSQQTKFLKNIATVYNKASTTDAVNIIQHQLLIQAIDDTLASYDGIDYGLIRAKMQHEGGAWISLAFAGEWLPAMLGVFKIVTYACFILILPLFIVSGGIGIYLGWMRVIFSFSLWPSLYTILNMVVDYSYDTSKIITYGALSTSRNQYDIIGVVAAGLGMAIPFLASWIVRMGEGGLVHLATPIMQSMSGGVASAGAEMASGNVSLNNRNIGNESYNNISSDKLNTNFEQFSGSNTFNHDSGMVETRTAGGDQILRTGEGINLSKFHNNINMRENVADSITKSLGNEQTYHDGKSVALQTGINTQQSQLDEYVSKVSRQVLAGKDINWSALGNQSEAVAKAVHHDIQTQKGLTDEQRNTASMTIRGYLGVQGSKFGKIFGLNAGVDASVTGEVSRAKINTTSQNTSDTESQGFTKNYDAIRQAAENKRFNESWGADKDLVKKIDSTKTSNMGLQNDITKSKARVDSLRNSREQVNSFSSEFNANATHKVADKLKDNYGMSAYQVQRLIDDPTAATASDRVKLNSAIGTVRDDYVRTISSVPKTDMQDEFRNISNQGDSGMTNLTKAGEKAVNIEFGNNRREVIVGAANDGVSREKVEGEIAATESEIRAKNLDIKAKNREKLKNKK